MSLHKTILEVKKRIEAGTLRSEAAVSQGILMPILGALGWDIFNTLVVWPEYPVEGGRVDFALCHPPEKPAIIIEVKNIGKADDADEQLFRYAFHVGAPIVILTDGQDWSFYFPSGSGNYSDRRFYKIDIVERDTRECEERFFRYLAYSNIANGNYNRYAREDYDDTHRGRVIKDSLPEAWEKLLQEENTELIKVLSEKVADICGFEPNPKMVLQFLKNEEMKAPNGVSRKQKTIEAKVSLQERARKLKNELQKLDSGKYHLKLYGESVYSNKAVDILRDFFERITISNPTFAEKFMKEKHGKTRRYLASTADELYPGRPDFAKSNSTQLKSSYWISTHYSTASISKIIKQAAKSAGLKNRTEFKINF